MPFRAPGLRSRYATDDAGPMCLELERPHGGDRRLSSARHFVLGDHEPVAVPRANKELAFPTGGDFAGDGAIEEAVPNSFDDDLLDMRERASSRAVMGAHARRLGMARRALCLGGVFVHGGLAHHQSLLVFFKLADFEETQPAEIHRSREFGIVA